MFHAVLFEISDKTACAILVILVTNSSFGPKNAHFWPFSLSD